MGGEVSRLNILSLGLAVGLWWGLGFAIIGILGMAAGVGVSFIETFSIYYIGFAPTVPGIIVGFLWGLLDGFIGGVLIAAFYNIFSACSSKCFHTK